MLVCISSDDSTQLNTRALLITSQRMQVIPMESKAVVYGVHVVDVQVLPEKQYSAGREWLRPCCWP
jgi:hypothetical protein